MSNSLVENLQKSEANALRLFHRIEEIGLIRAGRMESDVNRDILQLAQDEFGIKKFWHKRIVRAGENTLHPYDVNPPDLEIQKDDILFLDFGPIFEAYEADVGRTYVLGNDPLCVKLSNDIEHAWFVARDHFLAHPKLTASEFYAYCVELAQSYGWEYGGDIAGHVIGQFPHVNIGPEKYHSYLHPNNHNTIVTNETPYWIIEIHFVDRVRKIGGFFEQLAI
jgi:Xaa-Pro aminopeptidase